MWTLERVAARSTKPSRVSRFHVRTVTELKNRIAIATAANSSGAHLNHSNNYCFTVLRPFATTKKISNQSNSNNNDNKNNGSGRPDIEFINSISKKLALLQQEISKSTTVQPLWYFNENDSEFDNEKYEVFTKTKQVVRELLQEVEQRNIFPESKHRQEFNTLVERTLRLYNHCCSSSSNDDNTVNNNREIYDACTILFRQMEYFRLEMNHMQCHHAVQIAAKAGKWSTAAELYTMHIDPSKAGYFPVTFSNTTGGCNPIVTGLYCIAKAAIESNSLPVENVFQGVSYLSSVSPGDSEKFVLAAGVALGYAGEWKALMDYLKTSYKASTLGQPLVAAAMHACVLCGRHDEALALFNEMNDGELAAASEWHWGGGHDRLHPACRDLALRALGQVSTDSMETCDLALHLYGQILDLDVKMSVEALDGLLNTCARANRLDEMVEIFLDSMDSFISESSWLVLSDDLHISMEESNPSYLPEHLVPKLGILVNNVMRNCNSRKQYGLALLCLRIFEVSAGSDAAVLFDQFSAWNEGEIAQSSKVVASLLPVIACVENSNELLTTTMVSLCGVGLLQDATALFDIAVTALENTNEPGKNIRRREYDVYAYAEHLRDVSDPSFLQSPESECALRHMHRLTACLVALEQSDSVLSLEDSILLSQVLASAVRDFVVSNDGKAGIFLGKWAEKRHVEAAVDSRPLFVADQQRKNSPFQMTDSLLSSAIEAFRSSGDSEKAEGLVRENLGSERPPSDWLLSYNEAIKTLLSQGRNESAMTLFKTVIASERNPSIFCTAAQYLKTSGDWRAVVELYRLALSSGCSSEQLSMLALESVVETGRLGQRKLKREFPLLRSIIAETAKAAGMNPAIWLESNYFKLKQLLGFSTARLIMGWEDYHTCLLDELELAIEILEKRSRSGLTPKHGALFTIVRSASKFEQFEVPPNRTGLPKIPRDRNAWLKLLEATLNEAKDTRLMSNPKFIHDLALAYRRLGCDLECVDFVNDAVSRGLNLSKSSLQCASEAADNAGIEGRVSDIRMLLDSSGIRTPQP